MNNRIGHIMLVLLNFPRILPHIICYVCSRNRTIIKADLLARPTYWNLSPKEKAFLLFLWGKGSNM